MLNHAEILLTHKLESELQKSSIKANLTLGYFPIFHFYAFSQETSENEMRISQMPSFICRIANFSSHKMSKTYSQKEKFSVCFFSFWSSVLV